MGRRLGELLARSLAAKDAMALRQILQSDVDFRAMTPGKFWESNNVDVIVDETILGIWFGGDRQITEILAVETDSIGSLNRVGYRLRVESPDGDFVIEQQAYFATHDDKIAWLRIMCTGFLSSSHPGPEGMVIDQRRLEAGGGVPLQTPGP
ncbi:MAG TPA: hypothetical protein VHU85_13925 [Acidimicrobiales bacterium]|jgi:hypothetical protein|nr:hypothetical protein [Acidimicrobiales bacterium]